MLNLIIFIKWLSNYVMNHVLELFINLKTNKRHEENFGVANWFVKKL